MIERPPKYQSQSIASQVHSDGALSSLISKINDDYDYWTKVKYLQCPPGFTHEQLWGAVKQAREGSAIHLHAPVDLSFSLTNRMLRLCHEFDMNFGGSWGNDAVLNDANQHYYLISSIMEEAIFSSQMEGAATTRRVAKDMLRKNLSPRDKSQQMIVNNYQTINFIIEHMREPLTVDLLLQVHRLMTEKTLQHQGDAGTFRHNNDVVVENGITHEVVHTPPSFDLIPDYISKLCNFFNAHDNQPFIHPIIRGIIIHFVISWVHPFVDGNGRTARALFYWYMLRNGYWITQYMSISRVIAKSKKSYEKAFLYTELDDMDLGYFITYNLQVLNQSFQQLQHYIQKKQQEQQAAFSLLRLHNVNARQAQIIQFFLQNPKEVLTIKELQNRFSVSPTTAKTDVNGLLQQGILSEISFNKVKKGYVKGRNFDDIIN